MLYLETSEDGDQVFLHADEVGIAKLRETLDFLSQNESQPEHDHLFTPAWGGSGLDEQLLKGSRDSRSEKNKVVHEVKLYFWPSEQK